MGDVLEFRQKPAKDGRADVVLSSPAGKMRVAIMADGTVVSAPDVDDASRAIWDAVEPYVKSTWEETEIPRLKKQVKLLAMLLDSYDPDWRTKARGNR